MEIMSCRSCKRLFNYIGGQKICPACKEELEKVFYKVKEYIRDNPGESPAKVAEANEVDIKQINQWVREERLQFAADSDVALQCENCGKKIYTGRYCDDCKGKLANSLTKAFAGEKEPVKPKKQADTKAGMRFIKR